MRSQSFRRRRRRFVALPWPLTGRSGPGPKFILLPSQTANSPGSMLTVRNFSQHLVSSSKTVKPDILQVARWVGHCKIMWFAVCWVAPHSQFAKKARPHLYMDKQKRPTPERKQLSLTQAALGKPIHKSLSLTLGMKSWSAYVLLEYSILCSSIELHGHSSRIGCRVVYVQRVQMSV